LVRLEAIWFLVTNKRHHNHVKDAFSFQNQFRFLAAYLVELAQRINQLIVTNQENSSYIQHEERNFPKSSNLRE
jgi:hypothetical protein